MFPYALSHEGIMGIGYTAPRIFNLCTRWIWVVCFKHRSLCSWGRDFGTHRLV